MVLLLDSSAVAALVCKPYTQPPSSTQHFDTKLKYTKYMYTFISAAFDVVACCIIIILLSFNLNVQNGQTYNPSSKTGILLPEFPKVNKINFSKPFPVEKVNIQLF